MTDGAVPLGQLLFLRGALSVVLILIFARWLGRQRNDLQGPAEKCAPDIAEALTKLRSLPAVSVAGMSGSGATCFGLVKDMAAARHVARIVQVSQMNWWVAPAEVM